MASNGGTSPEQTGSHAGAPASAVALRPTSLAAARAKRKTGGGRGGHHKKGKKTENVLSAVLEIPRGSPTSGAAGSPVFFKTFLCSPPEAAAAAAAAASRGLAGAHPRCSRRSSRRGRARLVCTRLGCTRLGCPLGSPQRPQLRWCGCSTPGRSSRIVDGRILLSLAVSVDRRSGSCRYRPTRSWLTAWVALNMLGVQGRLRVCVLLDVMSLCVQVGLKWRCASLARESLCEESGWLQCNGSTGR